MIHQRGGCLYIQGNLQPLSSNLRSNEILCYLNRCVKRPEVSLFIQSHDEFSSSSGFRLLEAKWGKIFALTCFTLLFSTVALVCKDSAPHPGSSSTKALGPCHIPGARKKG